MPWILAKDDKKDRATILYNLADCIRIISVLISPLCPIPRPEYTQLDGPRPAPVEDIKQFGKLPPAYSKEGEAIFPRIEKDPAAGAKIQGQEDSKWSKTTFP